MSYNPNFSSISAIASAESIQADETNNSGGTLVKLTPVRISALGDIDVIDVSIEAEALAIAGVLENDVTDGSSGDIINTGRVFDITTSAAVGDILYVSKAGGITNTKPTVGVDSFVVGDFVIRLGIVAKNKTNPANKDLLVNVSIVGQL